MRPDYRNLYRFANRTRSPKALMPAVPSDRVDWILSQPGVQVVGRDLALTNTSSGNRESIFDGGEVRATNLVDTDLTNWTIDSGVAVTEPSSGVYRLAFSSASPLNVYFVFADSSTTRHARCEARLISGVPSDADSALVFRNSGFAQVGTKYSFSNLTSDWQIIDSSVLSTDGATDKISFRFDENDSPFTIEVRNVRATNTAEPVSAFPVGSGAGFTKVDQVTVSGLPVIGVMAGATNLVDTDLTNWETSGSVTVDDNGDGTFTQTVTGSNSLRYQFASVSSQPYTFTFSAKRGTKTINNVRVYDLTAETDITYTINNGSSVSGAQPYDSDINGGEFSNVDIRFTGNGNVIYVYLSNGGDNGTTIFKDARTVNLSAPAAAFTDGSGAGEVYAVDTPTCTPTWGSAGTIVQAVLPYGYSGSSNPVSAGAKTFIATNLEVFNTGNQSLVGSGGAPSILSGVALSDGTITIESSDWNGADIGFRVNGLARQTATEVDTPSGALYIGNSTTTARPFQGWLMTIIIPWVISDEEYSALRSYLTNSLGYLLTQ